MIEEGEEGGCLKKDSFRPYRREELGLREEPLEDKRVGDPPTPEGN